mmetsp:Transcript_36643/g.77888  ORF Transcript_36643/g.77888 Transcript_36643/m.77888 type:complete len:220 (-) Transcript_36643:1209-1868(-)
MPLEVPSTTISSSFASSSSLAHRFAMEIPNFCSCFRSSAAESSKWEQYSLRIWQISTTGTPLMFKSLPISSVACLFPMLAKRTMMMSTCCKVKSPASHLSKYSCSSSSTSRSRSMLCTCPAERSSSARFTDLVNSSCISISRSSFSKLFSMNLFRTRATAVPVQKRQRDWMMEVTCSSCSRASALLFVLGPFFMKKGKRTGSPNFSTKIWQLTWQCRVA